MIAFTTLAAFALAGLALVFTDAFKPPVGSGGFMISTARSQRLRAKRRRVLAVTRWIPLVVLAAMVLAFGKDVAGLLAT
jgi:hypothetical protein